MAVEQVVGLVETIAQLRADLAAAMAAGRDGDVRFRLGPVELELDLVITCEAAGDGGVRLGVVSLGLKGRRTSVHTHRVKLTLEPVDRAGERAMVRDRIAERPG